jgi:hypothetical protein
MKIKHLYSADLRSHNLNLTSSSLKPQVEHKILKPSANLIKLSVISGVSRTGTWVPLAHVGEDSEYK